MVYPAGWNIHAMALYMDNPACISLPEQQGFTHIWTTASWKAIVD